MTDPGEEWVMRPVLEGLCSYVDVISARLTLLDIAIMNEALDVRDENASRAQHAAQAASRNR